jgi:excisionase family DNA binding protein
MRESLAVERRTYSIPEAGKMLGISRGAAYDAARDGSLPTIKIGGRILVPKAALDRMLNGDPEAGDQELTKSRGARKSRPSSFRPPLLLRRPLPLPFAHV